MKRQRSAEVEDRAAKRVKLYEDRALAFKIIYDNMVIRRRELEADVKKARDTENEYHQKFVTAFTDALEKIDWNQPYDVKLAPLEKYSWGITKKVYKLTKQEELDFIIDQNNVYTSWINFENEKINVINEVEKFIK